MNVLIYLDDSSVLQGTIVQTSPINSSLLEVKVGYVSNQRLKPESTALIPVTSIRYIEIV